MSRLKHCRSIFRFARIHVVSRLSSATVQQYCEQNNACEYRRETFILLTFFLFAHSLSFRRTLTLLNNRLRLQKVQLEKEVDVDGL
ncbi:Hypothetical predicted protein [Scomber scombrus]|uniref:Secreted protein n=1 Tax=Scomber scombrus TaxID=13677 RepID=A0AAV1Q2Q5_SCOSC